MKKFYGVMWAAAVLTIIVTVLMLAACGSTGPSKADLKRQEQERQRQEFVREMQQIRQQKEQTALNDLAKMPDRELLRLRQGEQNDPVLQELIEREIARREAQKAEAERLAQEKAAAERKAAEERAAAAQAEERQTAIDAANARGVTAEDFDYDIIRDGTGIVITGYKGMATIVNIPAVIEGLPVKELGTSSATRFSDDPYVQTRSVFSGNTQIVSVTLPDSVTAILDGQRKRTYGGRIWGVFGAFENCTSLTSVTLPRNLKKIPDNMFAGCTGLTLFTIPEGVTDIGEQAFAECSGLTAITLPNSVTTIGRFAFYDCPNLESVTLPESLTFMGAGAFKGCGLTGIVLPGNLRTLENSFIQNTYVPGIGDYKIYYRDKSIDYETSWLGAGQFEDCGNLESVIIESGGLILFRTFAGCVSLTTLTINGNITLSTDAPAFSGCRSLTAVNIGPNVTRIGNPDDLINTGNLSIAAKAALARLRKDTIGSWVDQSGRTVVIINDEELYIAENMIRWNRSGSRSRSGFVPDARNGFYRLSIYEEGTAGDGLGNNHGGYRINISYSMSGDGTLTVEVANNMFDNNENLSYEGNQTFRLRKKSQ